MPLGTIAGDVRRSKYRHRFSNFFSKYEIDI